MNSQAVVQHLVKWLRTNVAEAGASGVVLGISGGVDSAVAAAIAKKAFPDHCMALFLPCKSHITDRLHSQTLAEEFDIPYRIIELDNAYNLLITQFESYVKLDGAKGRLLRANLKPRLRMMALYYSAQARNYLVLGTSNKSEITVGYSTKHGDTAVDLQILGDLLKSEVFELARYLNIPAAIIDKPPSGGLWSGQTDEEEMGFSYEELDDYLAFKKGEREIVERIEKMMKVGSHKYKTPPVPIIPNEYR